MTLFINSASNIAYPLSVIFNLSLQSGQFPEMWLSAIVTPVFKKGSRSDLANYRLISLTCVACILMEHGDKASILNHLLNNKIISQHQHGCLNKKSTATQLLECCLDWNLALNAGHSVHVVYLDYAKAFDTVVHSKLVVKLSWYGINSHIGT